MKLKNKKILSFICLVVMLFTTLFSDLSLIASSVYAATTENTENITEAEVEKQTNTLLTDKKVEGNTSNKEVKNEVTDTNNNETVAEEKVGNTNTEAKKENLITKNNAETSVVITKRKAAKAGSVKIEVQNLPSYMVTTVNHGSDPESIEGIYSKIVTASGKRHMAFCIECGAPLWDGDFTANIKDLKTYTKTDLTKAYKVAYVGWYSVYGDDIIDVGHSNYRGIMRTYAYTQQYIWEVLKQKPGSFVVSDYQAEYNAFKSRVNNKIKELDNEIPSFDATTITLDIDKPYTLTDSDGHFKNYPTVNKTIDGIKIEHAKGSNDLRITVTEECTAERYKFSGDDVGLAVHHGGSTSKVFMVENDYQDTAYTNYYPIDPTFDLTFNINQTGGLTIKKTNNKGNLIGGSTFKIWCDSTEYNQTKVVPSNGILEVDRLKAGTYKIQETHAGTNYLLNDTIYTVEVVAGSKVEENIVTVENSEPTGVITVTKKNTNGDTLGAGHTFKITATEDIYNAARTVKHYSKGQTVATLTTDSTGSASKSGLPLGKYTVVETGTVSGYLLNTTPKYVTLVYKDQNTSVVYASTSIANSEPTGKLSVHKEDVLTHNGKSVDGSYKHGDVTIEGAVYTLYAKNKITNRAGTITYFNANEPVGTYTFDKKGVAKAKITNTTTKAKLVASESEISGLPLGNFYLKETTVPNGYSLDTTVYTYDFTYLNSSTSVLTKTSTVYNQIKREPFEIIKISSITNDTAELIENAQFTAILKRYVDYYGSFNEALKHTSEFAEDEWDVLTTDSRGYAKSKRLAFGNYVVNETYVPNKDLIPVKEFNITIRNDSETPTQNWKIENDLPFQSYLKMVKKDSKTGKNVTYSNATFELYKKNGDSWDKVSCKVGKEYHSTWTTDSDGCAYTETKLKYGIYKLCEISMPTAFLELENDIIFEISASNPSCEYDSDKDAWITVEVKNEQPVGKLNITKVAEKIQEDSGYTYLAEDIDYTKISYKITAAENIINYIDGSLHYSKGQEIGTYFLDKKGKFEIELPLGKFYVQEMTTLQGYALDESIHEVEFTQIDKTTKVYKINLDFENNMTTVEVEKKNINGDFIKDATLELYEISEENGEEVRTLLDSWKTSDKGHIIKGLKVNSRCVLVEKEVPDNFVKAKEIEFTVNNSSEKKVFEMIDKQVEVQKLTTENQDVAGKITESEPLIGAELEVIDEEGNVVDSWVSSKEPHYVSGLIEGKNYSLIEKNAPEHYLIAEPIKFTVDENKENQVIIMKDKLDIVPITITKFANDDSLNGHKKGDKLENCEFTIYDKDGKVVKVITTEANGSVDINLLRGEYTICETKSPDFYLNDSEPQKIIMDAATTSLNIDFINNSVKLELDIDKSGIIQAQPNDEIRYDFKTLINKSNVPLNNFTWEDNLPYKYSTLTKLFTGTYNEDLDYDVYYKLVDSSEWIKYGTYNTMKNNFVDFTKVNGVVSDFKLCFGTVKAGFSAVDTPFIFTKVNSTVTKDDKWTNYTNLTGDYTSISGELVHLKDVAEWSVISYSYKLTITNGTLPDTTLPRTGDIGIAAITIIPICTVTLLLTLIVFLKRRKIRD